jgi:hypothetical protein
MSTSGLDRAYETTKQVITLSTGIIALTVTFAKEFKVSNGDHLSVPWQLQVSWLLYCASVIFGVWTLMAITGTNLQLDDGGARSHQSQNIRIPARLMLATFVGGVATTMWAGFSIVK